MDAVARRAGVGKSTVYLRWHDKDALLTDAVADRNLELTDVDTGSFRGDLRKLALNLLGHFHTPAGWAALRVTFDTASAQERLGDFAEAVTEFHERQVDQICQRATARGEMIEGFNAGALAEAIYGTAMVNSLTERLEGRSDTVADLERRADELVALVVRGIGVPDSAHSR
jgi:AcrR family transcriptional regulator